MHDPVKRALMLAVSADTPTFHMGIPSVMLYCEKGVCCLTCLTEGYICNLLRTPGLNLNSVTEVWSTAVADVSSLFSVSAPPLLLSPPCPAEGALTTHRSTLCPGTAGSRPRCTELKSEAAPHSPSSSSSCPVELALAP